MPFLYSFYALVLVVIVCAAIYNEQQKKGKFPKKFIILKEQDNCLTIVLSLALGPEFSKIPGLIKKLNTINGVHCIDNSVNWIRVEKQSNCDWKKLSPEVKRELKNNFKATLK